MAVLNMILLILSSVLQVSAATDTLTHGQSINSSQTIVSANGAFELGFFPPGQPKKLYLGIWYKRISIRTVVWVANREYPITTLLSSPATSSSSCFLSINKESNLMISDGKGFSFSFTSVTTLPNASTNTKATLLDSGNLVLTDDINSSLVLWQSFDHPTDTLLPGMKLGFNTKTNQEYVLTSWTSFDDPAPGTYSMQFNFTSKSEFYITKGSQRYWSSGPWNGFRFPIFQGFSNFSSFSVYGAYLTFSVHDEDVTTRFVMDLEGRVKLLVWVEKIKEWSLFWEQPGPSCQVYALCGAFSVCDGYQISTCQCLQGFEPNSLREWRQQVWSAGCVRKTSLQCGMKDNFVLMKGVKYPEKSVPVDVGNAEQCKLACLGNNSCSCSAYGYLGNSGCLIWRGDLLGIEQLEKGGNDLFIRVAESEVQLSNGGHRRQLLLIVLVPVVIILLVLGFFAFCFWRRKLRQRGDKEMSLDLLSFDFSANITTIDSELMPDTNKNASGASWDTELPLFSLSSVSAATDNFTEANKLGQGGFGPVYKGKLLNEQEVAIKRLSKGSTQGLEELKNEATLIAKLQHRNLVRLLGCCIEDDEKILIYEYMPNKSLDFFLFDSMNRGLLDWEKRIHIIDGIAQGLLYLHQHSRLRIIHRDLKASNILLDSKMNAKISDFGLARIFGGNDLQANITNRVVGTYGYMSPEYAVEGIFSIKSDVFSFGVLLLEILSGKRNTSFDLLDSLTLLGHAWNLWNNRRAFELIDPVLLGDSFSMVKPMRRINVALLCVQEQAIDRPTMSDVARMLSNDTIELASPKQPAFCTRSIVQNVLSLKPIISENEVTLTTMEGR